MAGRKVTIKWNKSTFEKVDVLDSMETFQAVIQSLSGVPADRQKMLLKGKIIKVLLQWLVDD